MDLRALRYFIETVRQGSFTVAAERLCVTQSTVSKMLRQLEDEVGQPLLHRDGRRIRVTDVGRILFDRGQEALGVMRELNREVADLTALARGELTVGLPPTVNLFFTPVVKAFRERHPGVRLTLVERGGQIIEQQVASGELEVGVTLLPVDPALDLATRTVGRHPIVAVGPTDAPWARQAQVDLSHLDGEALVLLHDDFALTRQLRDAFRRFGVEPRIVAQSGQRKAADGQPKLYAWHAPEVDCISKVRREVAYIIVSPAHKVGDETGRSVGRSLPVHALLATAACEATGITYRAFGPRRLPRGSGVTCQHHGGWDARLSGMVNRSELLQAS